MAINPYYINMVALFFRDNVLKSFLLDYWITSNSGIYAPVFVLGFRLHFVS